MLPVNTERAKKRDILDRIESIEQALVRAHAYLDTGADADWHGFRALFVPKLKNGKELPPHRDWVKNVFVPRMERILSQAERALERVGALNSRGDR